MKRIPCQHLLQLSPFQFRTLRLCPAGSSSSQVTVVIVAPPERSRSSTTGTGSGSVPEAPDLGLTSPMLSPRAPSSSTGAPRSGSRAPARNPELRYHVVLDQAQVQGSVQGSVISVPEAANHPVAQVLLVAIGSHISSLEIIDRGHWCAASLLGDRSLHSVALQLLHCI